MLRTLRHVYQSAGRSPEKTIMCHILSRTLGPSQVMRGFAAGSAVKPVADTIFAVSSGAGKAGVAVIRISGPKAVKTLEAMHTSKCASQGGIVGSEACSISVR